MELKIGSLLVTNAAVGKSGTIIYEIDTMDQEHDIIGLRVSKDSDKRKDCRYKLGSVQFYSYKNVTKAVTSGKMLLQLGE